MFRNEEYYIICNDDYIFDKEHYYKKKVKGRTFTYNGIKFGLAGTFETGYKLTWLDTGMLINGKIYKRLYDFEEDLPYILKIIEGFSEEKIKEMKKLLQEVKERSKSND